MFFQRVQRSLNPLKMKTKIILEDKMQTLKVNGMHCGHCKASVEEAAAKIPGVSKPEVDLAAKELRFEESGPVDLEALKTAIRDIGFDPE